MKFKGQMTGIVTRVERIGDLAVSTPPKEQISAFLDSAYVEAGLQPPLSGKLSPLDLKTRGLEDMTNASLQRSRQS